MSNSVEVGKDRGMICVELGQYAYLSAGESES